jgi:hypothetical protein
MSKRFFLFFMLFTLLNAGDSVTSAPISSIRIPYSLNNFGLKIGTLGAGIEYEHRFNSAFGLRLNANILKLNFNATWENMNSKVDASMLTAGAIADYHPFDGGFRVSAGAYYDKGKLAFDATTDSGGFTMQGKDYTGQYRFDSQMLVNTLAPYLGIGWSSSKDDDWKLTADLGILYHGKPKFRINKVTPLDGQPTVPQSEIDKDNLAQDGAYRTYRLYPVISIGIQRRF